MNNFYGIGHLEIPQRNIKTKPLIWYDVNNKNEDSAKSIFKKFKEITGYRFDNSHLKWSNNYGHLFVISIFLNKHKNRWDIHLWDDTGRTSLMSITQPCVNAETDVMSDDVYKKMCDISEKFNKGIIKCSDCGIEIKKEEVAGHYFAGSYCTKCWERKWKAIEAAENYD